MIVSPNREADRQALADILAILESATKLYAKNPNPELLEQIESVMSSVKELKQRVLSFDYTADDEQLVLINQLLNEKPK